MGITALVIALATEARGPGGAAGQGAGGGVRASSSCSRCGAAWCSRAHVGDVTVRSAVRSRIAAATSLLLCAHMCVRRLARKLALPAPGTDFYSWFTVAGSRSSPRRRSPTSCSPTRPRSTCHRSTASAALRSAATSSTPGWAAARRWLMGRLPGSISASTTTCCGRSSASRKATTGPTRHTSCCSSGRSGSCPIFRPSRCGRSAASPFSSMRPHPAGSSASTCSSLPSLRPSPSTSFIGQNGFFTAALLIAGLVNLDRRPVLSGVLFGILTIKPQLGLLLPLMLVVSGRWRTIVSAATTTAALVAATVMALRRRHLDGLSRHRRAAAALSAGARCRHAAPANPFRVLRRSPRWPAARLRLGRCRRSYPRPRSQR